MFSNFVPSGTDGFRWLFLFFDDAVLSCFACVETIFLLWNCCVQRICSTVVCCHSIVFSKSSVCRSRWNGCVKVPPWGSSMPNTIAFCNWESSIAVDGSVRRVNGALGADFFDFGRDDFPFKILLKSASKSSFFRFGVEIRFWSCKSLQFVKPSCAILLCFAIWCAADRSEAAASRILVAAAACVMLLRKVSSWHDSSGHLELLKSDCVATILEVWRQSSSGNRNQRRVPLCCSRDLSTRVSCWWLLSLSCLCKKSSCTRVLERWTPHK